MTRHNPIGLNGSQIARPVGPEHFGWFAHIAALGFEAVELAVPEPGSVDLAALRRAIADSGLTLTLIGRVNAARDLCSADAAVRGAAVEYLFHCCKTASSLGAKVVGGPIYGSPLVFAGRAPAPVSEDERLARIERAVAGLRLAAKAARETGVVFAIEPVNRYETDFLSTVEQGLELIRQIDHTEVGLLLDTFHMSMEEGGVGAAIRASGRHVFGFQANENHRGFIGTGTVDWVEVAGALRDIDYRGPIVLEPFRRSDNRLGVPLAQWRPPHEDESDRLREGLRILRTALAAQP